MVQRGTVLPGGFVVTNEDAYYSYLNTLKPHLKHKILLYLLYRKKVVNFKYVTNVEIGEKFDVHPNNAHKVLMKLVRRDQIRFKKFGRMYGFYIISQGERYANFIIDNPKEYNIQKESVLNNIITEIIMHNIPYKG